MYRFLSMFLNAFVEVILLIIRSLERICTDGTCFLFFLSVLQWCNWKKKSSVNLKYYRSENVFVSNTYCLLKLL